MKLIHDKTKATLQKPAEQMKTQYDKKKKTTLEYQKKLNNQQVGPFTVLQKHGLSAYKLKLLVAWKVYLVFNETLLMLYIPPAFSNQEKNPSLPPDIINSEEQYKTETILDHKTHKVHGAVGEPSRTVIDYLIK
ncbi:uncharacterized protein ARMOST_10586 [Armillaria ostoyae]|uniref:Tf2-1-like SH3-like domain-containing protein n=1 Tax=Armillaria ostoyae TaxID=47428 RepID=A0A284RES0_ARMOS|nr:uncharacterized protein ARMOST_10586 [Armillaria ostoyae]